MSVEMEVYILVVIDIGEGFGVSRIMNNGSPEFPDGVVGLQQASDQ